MSAPKKKKSPAERSLTSELSVLLAKVLLPDLHARAKEPEVHAALEHEWQTLKAAQRTADAFDEWQRFALEQIGAAWVLSCVFVRVLEDRDFTARRRLAGPGASDSEQQFFELFPSLSLRDYLLAVFREVAGLPGASELLGPGKNPAWRLSPSADACAALLRLFREEAGGDSDSEKAVGLAFGFAANDPRHGDTRFLGDLYQDLSAAVRERFALLQTPDFVEEFILDETLEPAIAEFGLDAVRLLDPTCGSGHFLLGAFRRLVDHHARKHPGLDRKEVANRSLAQVAGSDINPYAVAIARFRLTLAYLEAAGITSLARAPKSVHCNLAVADSLLHGVQEQLTAASQAQLSQVSSQPEAWGDAMFHLEDAQAADEVLGRRYHAVVGNPPYITCKDAALRETYRRMYVSAAGKYALAAPFTERFFQLAEAGGFVGLINSNSFMKREFGKKLIEEALVNVDLTRVIDTSGAFIPGHGTPTVLLFGRNRAPVSSSVPAVLGKRGEPSTPPDASKGLVWSSIAEHFTENAFENDFISVAELSRETLKRHPWSLGGGGAAELKELLEERAAKRLGDEVDSIGFMAITGDDDVFARPVGAWERLGAEQEWIFDFGIGEELRDWAGQASLRVFFPYRKGELVEPSAYPRISKILWPYRRSLLNRPDFGGKKYIDVGRTWYQLHQVGREKLRTPLSIAFAEVATHNHFVLDRGGKRFKQTAPIIKLREGASEDDHHALLAYLNSSTALFWMKQQCFPKGMHNGSESNSTPFLVRHAFSGTALADLPLPPRWSTILDKLAAMGRNLDRLSQQRCGQGFQHVVDSRPDSSADFDDRISNILEERRRIERLQVALQDEIDWLVYSAFNLSDCLQEPISSLGVSERPFEHVLANDNPEAVQTGWFHWNETNPPAAIPSQLSTGERATYQARADAIRASAELLILEDPKNKRRWRQPSGKAAQSLETDEKILEDQRQNWLRNDVERMVVEQSPAVSSLRTMSRVLADDPIFTVTRGDHELGALLQSVFEADSIPFGSAWLFSDTGLEKHAAWKRTWEFQRREDAGEKVGDIPVPPKYDPKDFRSPNYFRLRGKLDVPKERFISYPGCERDEDKSPLFGWAGWDHLQRATALAGLYHERKTQDGWPKERLTPILVGLRELVPWLKQWHNEPNADFGGERLGDYYERFVEAQSLELGLSMKDLDDWRPAEKKSKKAKGPTA